MKREKKIRAGAHGTSLSNRARALRLLFAHGAISRTDIAAHLNITTAAVTSIVNDLLEEGLVVQQDGSLQNQNQVGRRRLPITIDYNRKYILAIDIHSHYINIAITNLKGDILFEQSITPNAAAPKDLCSDIAKACVKMLWERSVPTEKILGAGVTAIGPVNQDDGIALHLFRLFDDPVPLRQYFEKEFPFPVAVENNVCASLLSELCYTDIMKDAQNILMLRWGPGVGSALAIHGKIYKGYHYQSPEIGHNLISEKGGEKCNCGQIGCLEPTVSTDAICSFIQSQLSSSKKLSALSDEFGPPSRKNLPLYLRDAPKDLQCFLEDRAHALATVTNNAIHILAPDRLILIGDLFMQDPIVKLFEEQLYAINPRLHPNLCMKAQVSANNPYIGAAAVVIEQLLLP